MGRKMGRPLIAPRLRRQKFDTSVSPRMLAIAEEGIERGHWESKAAFMDWLEPMVVAALEEEGVKLQALKMTSGRGPQPASNLAQADGSAE